MIKQSVRTIDQEKEANDIRHAPDSASSQTPTGAHAGKHRPLTVDDLGWTREEAIDTHFRLRPFEDEWNASDMDVYDDL